jgi:MFS family permease
MDRAEPGVPGSIAPGAPPGWLFKGVVLFSAVPMALAFSSVVPILPKMSAALAHDAAQAYLVKMVLGVVGVAMVLGSLAAGWLADKIERRALLVSACLLYAAAGAAPFLLDSLPLILASRLLMGLGGITAFITAAALIGDSFAEAERAKYMGVFTAVAAVGGLVAMLLAGALGDLSWRWPFLTYLVGAPLAVLAWAGLRGLPPPAGARNAAPLDSPGERAPFPFALAGLGLLIGIIVYAPSIYVPFHLGSLGAAKPSTIGQSLMLGMITSIASSALFGRARRSLSARAAFCWSFGVLAAGLVTIATAPIYAVALAGIFVQGLGIGWLAPNLMASAAETVEERWRGRTLGVVRAAYSLAPAVGVTALEPLARRIGPEGVILLTAGLSTLMLLGMAGGGWRRASSPQQAA